MTPRRTYLDFLDDMQAAARAAQRFIQGLTVEEFSRDERTLYATIRALEILGEAAKRIPTEVRARHPGVPWRQMTGVRDVVAHAYERVDPRVIWKTVQEDVPSAEAAIATALQDELRREAGGSD